MSEPVTILHGDVIEQLRTLSDESIQCCVTSPPYYGLRDYGTAQWIGGDPTCEHGVRRWDVPKQTQGAQSGHASKADQLSRRECVCGAKRVDRQIGMEDTPDLYVATMAEVFREVRRVLRPDGTLWLNLGDSFCSTDKWGGGGGNVGRQTVAPDGTVPSWAVRQKRPHVTGIKPKDLYLIPARVAMALQADGWYLRAACPWIKRNAMPESVKDRPATTIETIFLLTKSPTYRYDASAVKVAAVKGHAGSQFHMGKTAGHQQNRASTKPRVDDGKRSRRSSDWFMESWQGLMPDDEGDPLAFIVNTKPYKAAHFATFNPDLIRPCIEACTGGADIVLDPFGGSGTTGQVALELGRRAILIELNAEYLPLIRKRCGLDEQRPAA